MQENPTLSDASKVRHVSSFRQGAYEFHFSFFTPIALKLPQIPPFLIAIFPLVRDLWTVGYQDENQDLGLGR